MNAPARPSFAIRALVVTTIVFMIVIVWEFQRTEPMHYTPIIWSQLGASPVAETGTQTPDVFQVTVSAYVAGTAVPTPRPAYATSTPRPSCTSGLSQGAVCFGPTVVPTPVPVNVVATNTPIPIWPGSDQSTPGQIYQMGEGNDMSDYPR